MTDHPIGRTIITDRDMSVHVGGGAYMTLPRGDWLYQLRYNRHEPERGTKCDDRMLACSSLESYLYLITECSKDEIWRRIKVLREGLKNDKRE